MNGILNKIVPNCKNYIRAEYSRRSFVLLRAFGKATTIMLIFDSAFEYFAWLNLCLPNNSWSNSVVLHKADFARISFFTEWFLSQITRIKPRTLWIHHELNKEYIAQQAVFIGRIV